MIGWQVSFRAARELEKRQKWSSAIKIYKTIIASGETKNARVYFHLGNALFRSDELGEATHYISRAIEIDPSVAVWHYRLGFILERQGRYELAAKEYSAALNADPENPSWHYRLFQCHSKLGDTQEAFDHLRDALNGDPGNPRYHDLVAAALRSRGPRWQEAQALERGLPYHSSDPAWHLRMAECYSALSRYWEAAGSYRRANELKPSSPELLMLEADHWERAGNLAESEAAYSAALALTPDTDQSRFGIGLYHQRKGNWASACSAYEQRKRERPLDAELHFRAGLAHDRCFRWEEAAANYLTAVSLDLNQPYWHYKLGFAFERMQSWEDAVHAYEFAATQQPDKRYWWYRAGYACAKTGNLERACHLFLKSSGQNIQPPEPKAASKPAQETYLSKLSARRLRLRDTTNSVDLQRIIADDFASDGNWTAAAEGYEQAIFCSNAHDPQLYYQWGNALMQAGHLDAALQAFLQTRIFMTPDGLDIPKYLKNKAQKHSMQYLEYYETVDIRSKTILWESNHGASLGCHPLALFRHLVDLPQFSGWRHIWAVNDLSVVPEDLRSRSNVFFATPHSDLYLRVLATASHLVNNVSFPPYFMRRQGQRYLNTWHGTPFKTLGKDMRGQAMEHSNLARNFLHSSHIMSPNAHTSWALIERHDLNGLFQGKISITGSPRLDRMITKGDELRRSIRKSLQVVDDLPVVLYAPTWRGSTTDRVLDRDELLADLRAMSSNKYQLVFRAHRLTEKLLSGLNLGVTIVPPEIDTSDLLSAVDVLVTDYSSIAFDFMPTRRPIIYYTYDFDEYAEQRGLYLDPAEMPGYFCQDRDNLAQLLRDAFDDMSPDQATRYDAAANRFAPLEDGSASARVVDFFFNDPSPDSKQNDTTGTSDRPVALFHHSLIPNGIATSFRNLTGNLPSEELHKVLVVEPHVLNKDAARTSQLHLLPSDVQLVGRVGVQALRPEERWIQDLFTRQHKLLSQAQWEIYQTAMQREFYRVFGPTRFQAVVEFDGYSPFWTGLLAAGGHPATKRSIYLHNDMLNEWKMKFANLEGVFRLYPQFDNLISVSESLGHENAANLSEAFSVNRHLFTYCNNQIDAESVVESSKAPLDLDITEWFDKSRQNILAIGRLSPEKDHAKLISAFAKYHKDHPDSNLLIIGDGPLKNDLQHQIQSIGAEDYIMMAGQRPNPYPALDRASALVLSSLHEGQPMVLFEAMILNRPIICTDMPGPRDILQNRYGLIVENSVDGLISGLVELANGTLPQEVFDPRVYTKEAKYQFLDAAL